MISSNQWYLVKTVLFIPMRAMNVLFNPNDYNINTNSPLAYQLGSFRN